MAVLIEAFNVVVNDDWFKTKPEKRKLFLETIPTKAFCCDGLIYRIGFMDSHYANQYISFLEKEIGLNYQDKSGYSQDIVLVNMLSGPTAICHWFQFERKKHFIDCDEFNNSNEDFSIGWRIDSFEGIPDNYLVFDLNNDQETNPFYFKGLSVPMGWTPDNAIYESNYIMNPDNELTKTEQVDGVTIYKNKKTGENTYVGAPNISTYELLENSEEFQISLGGKIIRDEFGMCKLFGYRGNGLFNGELFDLDELTNFAINIIGNEYIKAESNLSNLNYHINEKPNFIIKSHKDIAVYVRVSNDNGDRTDFDKLKEIFNSNKENSSYIRLAIITFWEFNNGNWEKVEIGKNGSKDGVYPYIVNLKFESLLDQNKSRNFDEGLTQKDLLVKFEKAWVSQDTSIIEPYLNENFNYFSDWIFDILPSKEEYLEYFSRKLSTLKNNKIQVDCELVNNNNQYALLFNQNGEKAIFKIRTEKGRIIEAKMAKLERQSKITENNKIDFIPHSLALEETKVDKSIRNKQNDFWWKKLFKK